MKASEIKELREKDVADLETEITDARRQLLDGRVSGVVEGNGLGIQARTLRRHIARCKTIINEKTAEKAKAEVQA